MTSKSPRSVVTLRALQHKACVRKAPLGLIAAVGLAAGLAACAPMSASSVMGPPSVAVPAPALPAQAGQVVPHANPVYSALPASAGLTRAQLTGSASGLIVTRLAPNDVSPCRYDLRPDSLPTAAGQPTGRARFLGQVQGNSFCQFDLTVRAGQRVTLTLEGKGVDLAVFDRTDISLVSGLPQMAQRNEVWPVRVLLPRSVARRSSAPVAFTLTVSP